MINQFFGNYLLNEGIINIEQLMNAFVKIKGIKVKLGTIAINKGLLSAEQVQNLHNLQKIHDKKIGDLAVEFNYLSKDQLDELLSAQKPTYLELCQALLDENYINEKQFESIIVQYNDKFAYLEDEDGDKVDKLAKLLQLFYKLYDFSSLTDEIISIYFILLMNSFIRFIGDDFVFISMTKDSFSNLGVTFSQDVKEKINFKSYLTISNGSIPEFSKRFNNETGYNFSNLEDSISSFLSLNNEIFLKSLHSEYGISIDLNTSNKVTDFNSLNSTPVILIKLRYPFGDINFAISKNY